MTPANSWLVGYELTRVGEGSAIYPADAEWADPDLDHAAALLREVRAGGDAVRERAERGRRDVAAALSPERTGAAMRARLERLRRAGARRDAPRPGSARAGAGAAGCAREGRLRPGEGAGGGAGDCRRKALRAACAPTRTTSASSTSALAGRARGAGAADRRAPGGGAPRQARDRRRAPPEPRRRVAGRASSSAGSPRPRTTRDARRRGRRRPGLRGARAVRGVPAQRRRAHAARHARARRRRRQPRPGDRGVHARSSPPARRSSSTTCGAPENLGFVGNMNAAFARHRAGRRRDRQLRHGRARRVARAPARGGLLRRARGDREHAHQPRHDPLRPRPRPTRRRRRRPASRSPRPTRASRAPRRACTRASRPASGTASTSAAPRSSSSATSTRRSRPATARRSTSPSAASRAGCGTSSPTTSTSSTAARARSAAPAPRASRPTRTSSTAATRTTRRRCGRPRRRRRIPLARSLAAARLAVGELSVTIDGSCLGPTLTGTQVLALELAGALARRGDVRLRVTVPRSLGDRAREALDALGRRAHVARRGRRRHRAERHRPPALPGDHAARPAAARPARPPRRAHPARLDRLPQPRLLRRLRGVARLPRADPPGARVRRPRRVLLAARAATTRCAEDLVDDERAALVPLGIDHRVVVRGRASRSRPPGVEGRPFLLCLGTDFLHKNHPFALALFAAPARAPTASTAGSCSPARTRCAGTSRGRGGGVARRAPALAADVVALGEAPEAREGVAVPPRRARALPDDVRGLRLHPVRGRRGGRAVAVGRPVLDGRPAAGRARRDRAVGRRGERRATRPADRRPAAARRGACRAARRAS